MLIATSEYWDAEAEKEGILEEYFVGYTYNIPGPSLNKSTLFEAYFDNDQTQIRYALEFPGDNLENMLISSTDGSILFAPESVGAYTVAVVGIDGGGHKAVVRTWDFVIRNPERFQVHQNFTAKYGDNVTFTYNHTVNATFSKPGPKASKSVLFENVAFDNPDQITFLVQMEKEIPGTVFVDAEKGDILATVEHVGGNYSMVLLAVDGLGQTVTCWHIFLNILYPDTRLDSNGTASMHSFALYVYLNPFLRPQWTTVCTWTNC